MKPEDQAGFIEEGGGGTACKVDPELCMRVNLAENRDTAPFSIYDSEPHTGQEFYAMTLNTFRQHPIKWFKVKFPVFLKYWNSQPAISSPTKSDFPNSELSAIGFLILVSSFFIKRFRKHWFGPAFITLTLIGATIGPSYLAHFEVRYLVAVKFVGLMVLFGASGFAINRGLNKFLHL